MLGPQAPVLDAGHALADALVAMLILSTTLILSLAALGQARDVAAVALETRRAQSLLTWLLVSRPASFSRSDGRSEGFAWSVETSTTGAERPIEVCRRAVALTNLQSGRAYQAATLEPCPLEAAP